MLIGRRYLELSRDHIPGYSVSAFVSDLQFISVTGNRPLRPDLKHGACARFQNTLTYIPHQNDGQTVSGLVNVARKVKFGQQLLSCNWLRACCMGKHNNAGNFTGVRKIQNVDLRHSPLMFQLYVRPNNTECNGASVIILLYKTRAFLRTRVTGKESGNLLTEVVPFFKNNEVKKIKL